MSERLREIRERAEKATFGPWGWFGDIKTPYLATTHGGRVSVLTAARSGMRGATFCFRGGAVNRDGLVKAEDVAVRERDYRDDIECIAHPDAEFIAHAREDVPFLLQEIDRLRDHLHAHGCVHDGLLGVQTQ
ncbi:MAG: hypothetical protein KGL39_34390 [Patescibacteria group bacterium]|nr:hypothetical protein [Patescibacteria group bacterium]